MRRIEMIGTPLSHVQTPGILNSILEAAGENLRVLCRETAERELPAYFAAARQDPEIVGLVVTTPLKRLVRGHLTRETELVRLAGSSNCVRFEKDATVGANFDGFGLVLALNEAGLSLTGRTVLLSGCGGAGSAIAASLAGVAGVTLAIYDPELEMTLEFVSRLKSSFPAASVEAALRPQGNFDVLINASPVGMAPDDPLSIPAALVERADAVIDIVAAPKTRLRDLALAQGKTVVDGAAMVRAQARLLRRFICSGARSESETLRDEGVAGPLRQSAPQTAR